MSSARSAQTHLTERKRCEADDPEALHEVRHLRRWRKAVVPEVRQLLQHDAEVRRRRAEKADEHSDAKWSHGASWFDCLFNSSEEFLKRKEERERAGACVLKRGTSR